MLSRIILVYIFLRKHSRGVQSTDANVVGGFSLLMSETRKRHRGCGNDRSSILHQSSRIAVPPMRIDPNEEPCLPIAQDPRVRQSGHTISERFLSDLLTTKSIHPTANVGGDDDGTETLPMWMRCRGQQMRKPLSFRFKFTFRFQGLGFGVQSLVFGVPDLGSRTDVAVCREIGPKAGNS